MARLFGTDGVRGEANVELTPELAYRLGRAATLYFGENSETMPKILIARPPAEQIPAHKAASNI